jgi:hypothetical protein
LITFKIDKSIRYQSDPTVMRKSKAEKYLSDSGEFAVAKPNAAATNTSNPPVDSRPKKSRRGDMRDFMASL